MGLLDFCPDFVGMEVRHCKLLECSHFIASLNAVNDRPQLYSFFCCAGGRRVGAQIARGYLGAVRPRAARR